MLTPRSQIANPNTSNIYSRADLKLMTLAYNCLSEWLGTPMSLNYPSIRLILKYQPSMPLGPGKSRASISRVSIYQGNYFESSRTYSSGQLKPSGQASHKSVQNCLTPRLWLIPDRDQFTETLHSANESMT